MHATAAPIQHDSAIENATRDILRRGEHGPHVTGHVLIVDDDQAMAETLTKAMTRRGFLVAWKTSAVEALALLDEQDFDVVVTNLHMEGMNGFALCERIAANRPDVPVVMITAFGSLDSAVGAIRVGAYDFITKPFDVEMLAADARRARSSIAALREEVKRLRQASRGPPAFDEIVGASAAMRRCETSSTASPIPTPRC